MLKAFVELHRPPYMTAYTRNPAMLMSIAAQAEPGCTYPLSVNHNLLEVAGRMNNVSIDEVGVGYHLGRYGKTGLYGGFDPAEKPFGSEGKCFKDRFPGLSAIGNALVVVAKIYGGDEL